MTTNLPSRDYADFFFGLMLTLAIPSPCCLANLFLANQTIFLIFLPSLFMGERLIAAPLVSTRVQEREVVEIVVFLKGPCGC